MTGEPTPFKTDGEIRFRVAEIAKEVAARNGEDGLSKAVVIIRAHRDAKFDKVYRLMRACQEAGLRKLQLRAIIQSKG